MKKIIVTLAIAISTLSAFASEENVSAKVLDAFRTEFSTATEVEWTVGNGYYTAAFIYNNKHIYAYYTAEGELLGITHYISPLSLPINLQSSLKNRYNGYWVSDLFEVSKNNETIYYITLENADTKLVLKSTGGSDWSVYKKIKKA
jgi:hypothetical protein